MLYARTIELRNCGRFTHVSSDFGSQYHTHMYVTSEALYAGLTHEFTWRHEGRFIDLDLDSKKSTSDDYFFCDYDLKIKPIWFAPGIFVDDQSRPLTKRRDVVDKNDFNVVDEDYPSTGGTRIDGKRREYYCPKYGRIEGILPDHRLFTFSISPSINELESFKVGQTFMMGKKRTMFQITRLSPISEGSEEYGLCKTWWLGLPPNYSTYFQSFEILAATMRYIILRGITKDNVGYVEFKFPEVNLQIPEFYWDRISEHM